MLPMCLNNGGKYKVTVREGFKLEMNRTPFSLEGTVLEDQNPKTS